MMTASPIPQTRNWTAPDTDAVHNDYLKEILAVHKKLAELNLSWNILSK